MVELTIYHHHHRHPIIISWLEMKTKHWNFPKEMQDPARVLFNHNFSFCFVWWICHDNWNVEILFNQKNGKFSFFCYEWKWMWIQALTTEKTYNNKEKWLTLVHFRVNNRKKKLFPFSHFSSWFFNFSFLPLYLIQICICICFLRLFVFLDVTFALFKCVFDVFLMYSL